MVDGLFGGPLEVSTTQCGRCTMPWDFVFAQFIAMQTEHWHMQSCPLLPRSSDPPPEPSRVVPSFANADVTQRCVPSSAAGQQSPEKPLSKWGKPTAPPQFTAETGVLADFPFFQPRF